LSLRINGFGRPQNIEEFSVDVFVHVFAPRSKWSCVCLEWLSENLKASLREWRLLFERNPMQRANRFGPPESIRILFLVCPASGAGLSIQRKPLPDPRLASLRSRSISKRFSHKTFCMCYPTSRHPLGCLLMISSCSSVGISG